MPWTEDPYTGDHLQTPAYENDDDLQDRDQQSFLRWGQVYDPDDVQDPQDLQDDDDEPEPQKGAPRPKNTPWAAPTTGLWGPPTRQRSPIDKEAPNRPHLVRTGLGGKKTHHDPRTGRQLDKKINDKDKKKLKKPGWW